MLLLANFVCLAAQREEAGIDLFGLVDSELVEDVPRGVHLNTPEERVFGTASQHEMTVQPMLAGLERGEAHSHMESDPRLLW